MCSNTPISKPTKIWNSLEATKIFLECIKITISIFVPLAILYVGENLKSDQANRENETRVIALRFDAYQKMSEHLNNIYTYFTFRGQWKEFTPPEIIAEKRAADKIRAINQHLFSNDFNTKYDEFIKACFAEGQGGWGKDAPLKTTFINRKYIKPSTRLPKKENGTFGTFTWDDSWDSLFITSGEYTTLTTDNTLNKFGSEVEKKYNELNQIIAEELRLNIHDN